MIHLDDDGGKRKLKFRAKSALNSERQIEEKIFRNFKAVDCAFIRNRSPDAVGQARLFRKNAPALHFIR